MTELTMQFSEMTAEDFQAHLDQRSVNIHDAARVASWFSEDGVQRQVATGVAARGRDAIREAMQGFFIGVPDVHLQVRDLLLGRGPDVRPGRPHRHRRTASSSAFLRPAAASNASCAWCSGSAPTASSTKSSST